MNCLDFRRVYLSDPYTLTEEMESHLQQCHQCKQFAEQQVLTENQIKEAVNIDVPEGLVSRLLVTETMEARQEQKRTRKSQLKVILSMLATLGILFSILFRFVFISTEQLVLAHINDELDHLEENLKLNKDQINRKLMPAGVLVQQVPGSVRYAGSCSIRRNAGAHLVLEGKKGRVTVLVMPSEEIDGRIEVRDKRFQGWVVPFAGGSIAVVGEQGEAVGEWIGKLQGKLSLGA